MSTAQPILHWHDDDSLPTAPSVADRSLLVDAWNATKSSKRKAQIEALLWNTTTKDDRRSAVFRRAWLPRFIDTTPNELDARSSLMSGNPFVDPLWSRIDNGTFTARMAAKKLVEARKLAKHDGLSVAIALDKLLTEYDTWPKRMDGKAGVLVGVRPQGSLGQTLRLRIPSKRKHEETTFWIKMRTLIQEYLAERLVGVEPIQAVRLTTQFESDLKVLTDGWSGKILRAKAAGTDNTVLLVTQNKVSRACSVLRMDPPKKGKPVDMKKAQSNKRKLAREYHPDFAGDGLREQYQAVLAAYEVLESYEEMLTKK